MKLYINVTETVANKLKTGIQRVVREVVTHSDFVAEKLGIEVIPVVIHGKSFYRLDNLESLLNLEAPEYIHPISDSVKAKSIMVRVAKYALRRIPFAYCMAIKLIAWIKYRRKALDLYNNKDLIKIEQGDVVLLLDSFWSSNLTLNAAKKSRKQGATVITVIYDVIPISYSHYCDDVNVSSFSKAFSKVLAISDGVVTISKAVLDDVQLVTANKYPHLQSTLLFDYFYLGADFSRTANSDVNDSSDWPEGLWGDESVFLMVGTIEPRKGHAFILDAFEQRWKAGKTDKLLILGKIGWKTDALIERVVNSAYFGSKLFMLNKASDAVLNEAYQRAYACIQASYAEGFGLPLIEALQHGVPVIASDIPVFKEIATYDAEFFLLDDISSFNEAVENLKSVYETVKEKLESYKWLTWEESTEQLFSNVKDMVLEINVTK